MANANNKKRVAKTVKSVAKKVTKPVAKKGTKVVAKRVTKPIAKKVVKPVAKKVVKATTKTTAKSAAKTITKATVKSATKATAKTTAKKMVKPVAKRVTKPIAKKVVKPVAKKVVKATTKTTAKSAAKTITKATVKSATKATAKTTAKTTTKKAVKPVAKRVTKPIAKKVVKPVAKKTSAAPKKVEKNTTEEFSALKHRKIKPASVSKNTPSPVAMTNQKPDNVGVPASIRNKKRLLVSYSNMNETLAAAFKEKYPRGYSDYMGDLFKIDKPDGTSFYAISMETEDSVYLIKMVVTIDRAEDALNDLFPDNDGDEGDIEGETFPDANTENMNDSDEDE